MHVYDCKLFIQLFTSSFLCLAFLVGLTSYAIQYWNRLSSLNQQLTAHSYNIYLVHLIFVAVLQEILTFWAGGPPMVKAGIIYILGTLISIGISNLIKRFPRGFVAFLVALFALVVMGTRINTVSLPNYMKNVSSGFTQSNT